MSEGPMQLVVTGLSPEITHEGFLNQFILLERDGAVRLVDVVFVAKDAQGGMTNAGFAADCPVAARLPGALAQLLFGDGTTNAMDLLQTTGLAEDGGDFGLDKNAIDQIVDLIPRESLTAFVLLEHLWTNELKTMLAACGGAVIAHGWVTTETLSAMNDVHYMAGASDHPGEMWRSKPFKTSWS